MSVCVYVGCRGTEEHSGCQCVCMLGVEALRNIQGVQYFCQCVYNVGCRGTEEHSGCQCVYMLGVEGQELTKGVFQFQSLTTSTKTAEK